MKPYYHKVSLLLVIISILLASCKNEAPYFMRSYYCVNCFLDSNNVYSLEETVGRSLDASCSISNENDGVAELRVETGKHIVTPVRDKLPLIKDAIVFLGKDTVVWQPSADIGWLQLQNLHI